MEALRKYHNAIKSRCLEEAIRRTPDNEPSLLDLACGPGSDQLKWKKLGIRDVLALDSNEDAIIEARKRCANIGGGVYRFVIADCLNRLESYARQSRWSIITSNFALHYMMGDTLRFPLFMDAVTAALRPGGVFTGTLLNGDRLEALMGDSNQYDNGLMAAQKRGDDTVEVALADTYYFRKGASKEILVRPEALIIPALERGLSLVHWTRFTEYLDVPRGYRKEAFAVSGLYDCFMFVKKS